MASQASPDAASKPTSSEERVSREQQQKSQEKGSENESGESLTTILSLQQRTQLIILLAAATATMRDSLSATFDAKATMGSDMANYRDDNKKALSEDDKIMNPNIDPGTADVEAHDRERRMLAAREKELSEPKMKELKDAALTWFDGWREKMIARVGEVLRQKKVAKQHLGDEESIKHRPEVKAGIDRKIDPQEDASTDPKDGETASEKPPSPKIDIEKEDSEAQSLANSILSELCPPVSTPLAQLDESKRVLILHSMLLILLSLEHYLAPSRVLLLYLTNSLQLPVATLNADEAKTALTLLEAAKELSGKSEAEKKAEDNKQSRKWKVGLATVAGAAIVGVTGGLAAPLVAAGVGSVMGGLGLGATAAAGYLGSVAGSTLVVGGLFGAYGGRMTGQMMDAYAREVEDFAFLPVHETPVPKANFLQRHTHHKGDHKEGQEEEVGKDSASSRRLRVTIGISGWLTSKEEVVSPWKVLGSRSEVFALRWELENLMNLGNAMTAMVSSAAWGYAKKEIIAHSIFADMMAAMWPLGLLQVARVVDNPFSVAKSRAEKAGAVLADALENRAQGERPVTLVGYSLGARVIYSCLLSLAARRAFGLVESVVLIGAPVPAEGKDWRAMRSVVGGRLVNVYSTNDYVLGFLYRTSSIQLGVAGLQRVEGVMGVENVDVSSAVSGHLRYRFLVGSILRRIGFEDLDLKEVRREEAEFQKMLEEEKRRAEEMKSKIPKQLPRLSKGGDKKGEEGKKDAGTSPTEAKKEDPTGKDSIIAAASAEAETMEAAVREQTRKSMMQRGLEWWHGDPADKAKDVSEGKQDPADTVKETKNTADAATSSYLSYAKSALHLGSSSGSAGTSKEASAAVASEVPGATETDGKAKDGAEDRRSYLEMTAEGGRGVGSAASSWYQGAAGRIGSLRRGKGGEKEGKGGRTEEGKGEVVEQAKDAKEVKPEEVQGESVEPAKEGKVTGEEKTSDVVPEKKLE
ncbi:hypothetical protein MMC10_007530 [Thelotrema lepadinum]|nr:hypothetical protein [Thelotrema lepadinum]